MNKTNNQTDILISVIVPAYNAAAWLPRCIDSILKQTHQNLDVLLINDGSTDETPSIINHYQKQDVRVRALHQENRGLVQVRERGIEEAKGEFIGFVDGDDDIVPDMYHRLLNNAVKYKAQISQCGMLFCYEDGRRVPSHGTETLHVYDRTEGLSELLKGSFMEPSLCNKLFMAGLLRNSCMDPTIVNNEDLLRNAVLFSRAERSVMDDFCGYHYWIRKGSMSNHQNLVEIGRNILSARKQILDFVPLEVHEDALGSYLSAALQTYHSLIGYGEPDAVGMKNTCRTTLEEYRPEWAALNPRLRRKAGLLCAWPAFYEVLYKRYASGRNRRIRREAERTNKAKVHNKEEES